MEDKIELIEDSWEKVVDFTKIKKGEVDINVIAFEIYLIT